MKAKPKLLAPKMSDHSALLGENGAPIIVEFQLCHARS